MTTRMALRNSVIDLSSSLILVYCSIVVMTLLMVSRPILSTSMAKTTKIGSIFRSASWTSSGSYASGTTLLAIKFILGFDVKLALNYSKL